MSNEIERSLDSSTETTEVKLTSIQSLSQLQLVLELFNKEQKLRVIAEHADLMASSSPDEFIAFFSNYSGNKEMMEFILKTYLEKAKNLGLEDLKKITEAYVSGFASLSNADKAGYLHRFVNRLINNQHIKTMDEVTWSFSIVNAPVVKEHILNAVLKSKRLYFEQIAAVANEYIKSPADISSFAKWSYHSQKNESALVDSLYSMAHDQVIKDAIFKEWRTLSSSKEALDAAKRDFEIKKVGLVLGLSGRAFEREYTSIANRWTKDRFSDLVANHEPLAFHQVSNYKKSADFSEPIKKHGDLQGVHAEWKGHSFSFHLIKDGEQTHLIYVNRGRRHELAGKNEAPVSVFTFKTQEHANKVVSSLMDVLKTEDKSTISHFIHHTLEPNKNNVLSKQLRKSNQKVGNCTIANANIAWHLTLASRNMKQKKCSFSEAYTATKVAYKNMRMEDRAKSFCDLVTKSELRAASSHKEGVLQILNKMAAKDRAALGRQTVRFLVDRLYERDPNACLHFFKELSQSMHHSLPHQTYQQWTTAFLNKLEEDVFRSSATQKVNTQLDHIMNDPELFRSVWKNLPDYKHMSFLRANNSDNKTVSERIVRDPKLFMIAWEHLTEDKRVPFFIGHSIPGKKVLSPSTFCDSLVTIIDRLSSADKKDIMRYAVTDEQYINKLDSRIILHLLADLPDSERKGYLKAMNGVLSKEKKQQLVDAMHSNPSHDLVRSYSAHAGTFSATKWKLQAMKDSSEVRDVMKERARQDFTGASMNSLVDAHTSHLRQMKQQLSGLKENQTSVNSCNNKDKDCDEEHVNSYS